MLLGNDVLNVKCEEGIVVFVEAAVLIYLKSLRSQLSTLRRRSGQAVDSQLPSIG